MYAVFHDTITVAVMR